MTIITIATVILLALTDQQGHDVLVRADLIASTAPCGSDTCISLVNGQRVTVRQSVDEIAKATKSMQTELKKP